LGYDRDTASSFSPRFRVGTAMFKSVLNAATDFQWRWSPNEHRAESAKPFIGTQKSKDAARLEMVFTSVPLMARRDDQQVAVIYQGYREQQRASRPGTETAWLRLPACAFSRDRYRTAIDHIHHGNQMTIACIGRSRVACLSTLESALHDQEFLACLATFAMLGIGKQGFAHSRIHRMIPRGSARESDSRGISGG
jgi:hypothetical protein